MSCISNYVYACKSITKGKDTMRTNMLAMHKAIVVSILHRGIIWPRSLCHKLQMPICKYWNGGHLDHWI